MTATKMLLTSSNLRHITREHLEALCRKSGAAGQTVIRICDKYALMRILISAGIKEVEVWR